MVLEEKVRLVESLFSKKYLGSGLSINQFPFTLYPTLYSLPIYMYVYVSIYFLYLHYLTIIFVDPDPVGSVSLGRIICIVKWEHGNGFG